MLGQSEENAYLCTVDEETDGKGQNLKHTRDMEEIWARLTNGEDVKIRPYWDCCDGASDCGSGIDIYDKEDRLIGTMPNGTMPDEDEYDLSDESDKVMYDTKMAEFIADVERAIDEYER